MRLYIVSVSTSTQTPPPFSNQPTSTDRECHGLARGAASRFVLHRLENGDAPQQYCAILWRRRVPVRRLPSRGPHLHVPLSLLTLTFLLHRHHQQQHQQQQEHQRSSPSAQAGRPYVRPRPPCSTEFTFAVRGLALRPQCRFFLALLRLLPQLLLEGFLYPDNLGLGVEGPSFVRVIDLRDGGTSSRVGAGLTPCSVAFDTALCTRK